MNKKFIAPCLALALLCISTVGTYAAIPVKKDIIAAARQAAKTARDLARKTQLRVPRNRVNDHIDIEINRPLSRADAVLLDITGREVPPTVSNIAVINEHTILWRKGGYRRLSFQKKPDLENGLNAYYMTQTFDGAAPVDVMALVIDKIDTNVKERDYLKEHLFNMYGTILDTSYWDLADYSLWDPEGTWSIPPETLKKYPEVNYLFSMVSFSEFVVKNNANFPFFNENPTLDRYITHLWNAMATKQLPEECGTFLLASYLYSLNAADIDETLVAAEEVVSATGHLPGIRYFVNPDASGAELQSLPVQQAEEISLGMPTVLILRYLDRMPLWNELSPATQARVTALQIQLARDVQQLSM